MAYPSSACYDPTRSSWLPYWFDNAAEKTCKYGNTGGDFGDAVAQIYERIYYGETPRIYAVTPTPAAPGTQVTIVDGRPRVTTATTAAQLTNPNWTPQDAANVGHAAWTASIQRMIAAAEADGSYTPNPNLPTASWFDENKTVLLIAAAAVAGVVVLGAMKR